MPAPRSKGDNADGSRKDPENDRTNPVDRSIAELKVLERAVTERRYYGDLFLLLQLLEPWVQGREAIKFFPAFLTYGGDDCSNKWARYLQDSDRPGILYDRLQEALGVTQEQVDVARSKVDNKEWTVVQVAEVLGEKLASKACSVPITSLSELLATHRKLEQTRPSHDERIPGVASHLTRRLSTDEAGALGDENPVRVYLADAFNRRPCNCGPPRQSAMPARLRDRSRWFQGAFPTLMRCCEMCEAEFPNERAAEEHINMVHGGQRWYQMQYLARIELAPYIGSPTEWRQMVQRYSISFKKATTAPEKEIYKARPSKDLQNGHAWAEILCKVADTFARDASDPAFKKECEETIATARNYQASFVDESRTQPCVEEHRAFKACVCCAMQQWSENLHSEFLVGPQCSIPNREGFAECLSAEWYHSRWPLIPREELMASAVDFPHLDADGEETSSKILLQKRRVPPAALTGEVPVNVCSDCRTALWAKTPKVPIMALVNDLWLGRHPPLLRSANLAHQLLLALGRVVSTKLYLSTKGVDTAVRQEQESWRQKFLQYAIKGTSIVFGNGKVDQAMLSFPPEPGMLKDTFVAVFAGADQENGLTLSEEQQQAKALRALRDEVGLRVDKREFDGQAKYLMATNYVYNAPDVQCR